MKNIGVESVPGLNFVRSIRWFAAAALVAGSLAWPARAADPEITAGPSNAVACVGGSASFTVTVTGTEPLSFEWFHGAVSLGQGTNVLNLVNVQPADAGDYSVIVSNSVGMATSAVATLTVNPLPAVTVADAATCVGQPVTLSAVNDAANPSYLWSPGGQTTSNITVSPTSTTIYTVTVTDGVTGCSQSDSATVTVTPLPTVSVNSAVICSGDSAVLTATHTASSPTFLWSPGGETTESITNSPASTTVYTVTVTDGVTGCANSASGTIRVVAPPVNYAVSGVATQSTTYTSGTAGSAVASRANDGNRDGNYANGSVTHTGANPAIGGVLDNERAWEVDLLSAKDIGRVKLWLRTDCCADRNTNLLVLVYDGSHTEIWRQTNISTVPTTAPQTVDFPQVLNARYVRVQSLAAANHPLSLAEVEVFSAYGPAVTVTANPADASVSEFSLVTLGPVAGTLSHGACSDPSLINIQWRRNGQNIIGANGSTYSFTASMAHNGDQFDAVLSVPGSAATTTVATVTVSGVAPTIVTQPRDVTAPAPGGTASFSVVAQGTAPLAYQWLSNGVAIAGATASTYNLTELGCDSGGAFQVVVTNDYGAVTSAVATLSVQPVTAVSFDFETVGQLTNNLIQNGGSDPLNPILYEAAGAGTGSPAGRGLDLVAGGTLNDAVFTAIPFDFSQAGAVLRASIMFKVKAPTVNDQAISIGFASKRSRLDTGDEQVAHISARLRTDAQPATRYRLSLRHKLFNGTTVNTLNETATSVPNLIAGGWYKLSLNLTNRKAILANSFGFSINVDYMGTDGLTVVSNAMTVTSTNANADIVNDSSLFAGIRVRENCGIDLVDNFAVWSSTAAPAFTCQPTDQTVLQGRRAEVRAYLDGAPPWTYQWLKDSNVIAGATDWQYVIPAMSAADVGYYQLVVTSPTSGSITSSPALITMTADTAPPVMVSAGSFDGYTVGVTFDEPIDPVTGGTVGNYTFSSGSAYYAAVQPGGRKVLLYMSTPVSGAFTVTATGVQDLFGNATTGTSAGATVSSHLTSMELGGPLPPGSIASFSDQGFDITAGGADVWGTSDQFRFTFEQKTGDFDVKVRIGNQTVPNTVLKAGLMVRETLDPSARTLHAILMPPYPGLERYETGTRTAASSTTGGYGVAGGGNGNVTMPTPPWLRLQRAGNTFIAYYGTDGVNWTPLARTAQSYPDTVYVGLEMVSHVQNRLGTTEFFSYGDFGGYPSAVVNLLADIYPTPLTVQAGRTARFDVAASVYGAPSTELMYIWQRWSGIAWTNLPASAASSTYTTPALTLFDNGAQYRCILRVSGSSSSVTSSVATVTVTDVGLPTLLLATIPPQASREVVLTFSEPVSAVTALDTNNYTVTNSAGVPNPVIGALFLHGDPRTVVLTTADVLPLGNYGVVVNNVQDLAGNTIAANSTRIAGTGPVVTELYIGFSGSDLPSLTNMVNNTRFQNRIPDAVIYNSAFGHNYAIASFPSEGTCNNYGGRIYAYFVPPSNGLYKLYIRTDDAAQLWVNTNQVNSWDPAGARALILRNSASASYGTAADLLAQNVPLYGGQRHFIQAIFKEGSGGDGFALAIRAQSDTATPPATEVVSNGVVGFLEYPADVVTPAAPIVCQFFGGNYGGFGGTAVADLTNNVRFQMGLPDAQWFNRAFCFVQGIGDNGGPLANYGGRLFSYFVPPSNGTYRFYIRSDDASQLFMNTNAVNSTDPAGRVRIAREDGCCHNYDAGTGGSVSPVLTLVSNQPYYIEALWKEGGGGDGCTVAVRATDPAGNPIGGVPPNTEVATANLFAFPWEHARLGAVGLTGITPSSPTVTQGQTITFMPVGLRGGMWNLGYIWYKNGVQVFGTNVTPTYGSTYYLSHTYTTPPLALGDNGAVFTLVVTNQFSRAEASTTVTVLADATAPALTGASGNLRGDRVTLTFSEPLDPGSVTALGNYQITNLSGSLTVLGAVIDATFTKVTLTTAPQTPGDTYTVVVNGVRDVVGNQIAPNSTIDFTAWTLGGHGLLVEVFTNITGTPIANLKTAPKFINDQPDLIGYIPTFGFGTYQPGFNNFTPYSGNPALDNYGVRVSGYFVPPSNGLYRFYLKSDDASEFWMNTNGPDASGKVLLAQETDCCDAYGDQSGGPTTADVYLTDGTLYYMEGLMKEGGGGDYIHVAFRALDETGNPIGGIPPGAAGSTDPAAIEVIGSAFLTTKGDPALGQITVLSAPPADLYVNEFEPVNLALSATAPALVRPLVAYQWQRTNVADGTFTNIPGAVSSNLAFVARWADDGLTYRIAVSLPGGSTNFETVLHVIPDTTGPVMLFAGSLDGWTVDTRFDDLLDPGTAEDPSLWYLFDTNGNYISPTQAVLRADQRSVRLRFDTNLTYYAPLFGITNYTLYNQSEDTGTGQDFAEAGNVGAVEKLIAEDVGTYTLILNPTCYYWDTNINDFVTNCTEMIRSYTDPLYRGDTFVWTNRGFNVIAGGSDIWNLSDGAHMVYREVTGNFDIKVRVQSLRRADHWSKAGLMARGRAFDTNGVPIGAYGTNRDIAMLVTPTLGQNTHQWLWRDVDNGASAALYNANGGATNPPAYPDAWVRLQRSNAVFFGYFSTNGVDWTLYGSRDTAATAAGPMPDTLLVGMVATAHNNNGLTNTLAEFRDLYFPEAAVILTQPEPAAVTIGLSNSVTFSNLTATAGPGDVIQYLWRRNGVAVPGGTNAELTLVNLNVSDSGVYDCVVSTDGGGQTSTPCVLTVTNQLPVVVGETNYLVQNVGTNIAVADLLANDSDPEGAAVQIIGLSNALPFQFVTDFESGLPAGASLWGVVNYNATPSAWTPPIEPGGATGNRLTLTPNQNYTAGAIIISNFTGGVTIPAFQASFKVRIAEGTGNAADGLSLNYGPANSLPRANSYPGPAEEGISTFLAVTIDNYPTGGTDAPSIKVRWNNVIIFYQLIAKWSDPAYVEFQVKLDPDGTLDVLTNNVPIIYNLTLPGYAPIAGEFGIFARTGGENQTHWVDDINILVTNLPNFARTPRGGTVEIQGGTNIVYTPGANQCGLDEFYYVVSDGQLGGEVVGTKTLVIDEATPEPPYIVSCATNMTVSADATCTGLVPDFSVSMVVTDNCCCLTFSQVPAAGTPVPLGGPYTVTITVTDAIGLSSSCQATLTVADTTAPSIACPGNLNVNADPGLCTANPAYAPVVTDNCDPTPGWSCAPAGPYPVGATIVTCQAWDVAGNTNSCSFSIIVADAEPPAVACPPPQTVWVDTNTCSGTVPDLVTGLVTSDNCGVVSVTQSPLAGTPLAYGATVNVSISVKDAANNETTCLVPVAADDPITVIALAIERQDPNVLIHWPVTCATWTLQEAHAITQPMSWVNATNVPVLNGTRWEVLVPYAGSNTFYQIKRP